MSKAGTVSARAMPATLAGVLEDHALHQPEKRAFLFLDRGEHETQSLSFRELEARVRDLAAVLIQHGLEGQRAVLAYPTCLEFVVAIFACFRAGVIAIPAPLAFRGSAFSRIQGIVADSQAAAILSLSTLLGENRDQSEFLATKDSASPRWIATDRIENAVGQELPDIDPGALAILQYTSGSTGNPRGVMLTHANIMHNQAMLAHAYRLTPADTVLNWVPLYHDMGLIGGVLHSVYAGVGCILMPPLAFLQRPLRWLNAISRYRATVSMAPSFAFDLCTQRASKAALELDLSTWHVAICGGEAIRPAVLEDFAETFQPFGFNPKALLPSYGLAEATLLATSPGAGRGMTIVDMNPPSARARQVSCGIPAEGLRLAIVDPGTRRRVADGEKGEVWLQGPNIAAGYWDRPEETAQTFQATLDDVPQAGIWLRTGDLGIASKAGLIVTGRSKETIVVHGANLDPRDIEDVARASHPVLLSGEGGAFAIETKQGESVVLLYEIGRNEAKNIDAGRIASNVIEAVTGTLGLKLFDLVLVRAGTLPRTTSGKVQRHVCKDLYLAGTLSGLAVIEHPALGRCRLSAGESP